MDNRKTVFLLSMFLPTVKSKSAWPAYEYSVNSNSKRQTAKESPFLTHHSITPAFPYACCYVAA